MQLATWRLVAWANSREGKEGGGGDDDDDDGGGGGIFKRVVSLPGDAVSAIPVPSFGGPTMREAGDQDIRLAAQEMHSAFAGVEQEEDGVADPLADAPPGFESFVIGLRLEQLKISLLIEPDAAKAGASSAAAARGGGPPTLALAIDLGALHARARVTADGATAAHATVGVLELSHAVGFGQAATRPLLRLYGDTAAPLDEALGGPIPTAKEEKARGGLLAWFGGAESSGLAAKEKPDARATRPALHAVISLPPAPVPPAKDSPKQHEAAGAAAAPPVVDIVARLRGGELSLDPDPLWELYAAFFSMLDLALARLPTSRLSREMYALLSQTVRGFLRPPWWALDAALTGSFSGCGAALEALIALRLRLEVTEGFRLRLLPAAALGDAHPPGADGSSFAAQLPPLSLTAEPASSAAASEVAVKLDLGGSITFASGPHPAGLSLRALGTGADMRKLITSDGDAEGLQRHMVSQHARLQLALQEAYAETRRLESELAAAKGSAKGAVRRVDPPQEDGVREAGGGGGCCVIS